MSSRSSSSRSRSSGRGSSRLSDRKSDQIRATRSDNKPKSKAYFTPESVLKPERNTGPAIAQEYATKIMDYMTTNPDGQYKLASPQKFVEKYLESHPGHSVGQAIIARNKAQSDIFDILVHKHPAASAIISVFIRSIVTMGRAVAGMNAKKNVLVIGDQKYKGREALTAFGRYSAWALKCIQAVVSHTGKRRYAGGFIYQFADGVEFDFFGISPVDDVEYFYSGYLTVTLARERPNIFNPTRVKSSDIDEHSHSDGNGAVRKYKYVKVTDTRDKESLNAIAKNEKTIYLSNKSKEGNGSRLPLAYKKGDSWYITGNAMLVSMFLINNMKIRGQAPILRVSKKDMSVQDYEGAKDSAEQNLTAYLAAEIGHGSARGSARSATSGRAKEASPRKSPVKRQAKKPAGRKAPIKAARR